MSIRMGDKILAANYKPSNASEETAGIIKIATAMEITTQTEAIRRESFSSFSSRIAMKRTRICGMPK